MAVNGFIERIERITGNGMSGILAETDRANCAAMKTEKNRYITTPFDDLTYQIIGCAMAIHRNLGPGYREDTYQRDLQNSLTEKSIPYEAQKFHEVFDTTSGESLIGYYIPDFVVDGHVVVEIKALRGLDNSHLAQVIGYLAVTGCSVDLLINFGERSLKHRRILPPKNIQEHRVNRQWLFVPDWLKSSE